jgi:hypothetical protein
MPDTWQVGVFRPLLHRVPADAYQLHIQGIDVRFSRCGLPTKPTGDTAALNATASFCRDCLTNHRIDQQRLSS